MNIKKKILRPSARNPFDKQCASSLLKNLQHEPGSHYIFMAIKDKKIFKSIKIKAADEQEAEEKVKRQYPDWAIFYLWQAM